MITVRTNGNNADFNADHFTQTVQVGLRFLRQVFIGTDAADVAFPALEGFVDRFCLGQDGKVGRNIFDGLAVDFPSCSNLDFIQTIKDIQTSNG